VVHPEAQREREGEEPDLPEPKTESVAIGEDVPHVYLLVATALMPQNEPQ
jgi:hypothetical protein